ncbi:MAG: KAP family NTPase [Muribaculum sp.]|nr:KAP family NTPase [Muribaculum sp.]
MRCPIKKIKENPTWGYLAIALLGFLYVINFFPPHIIDALIGNSIIGDFFTSIYDSCRQSLGAGCVLLFFCITVGWFFPAKYRGSEFGRKLTYWLLWPLAIWILLDKGWTYPPFIWPGAFRYIYTVLLIICGILLLTSSRGNPKDDQHRSESESDKFGFSSDESDDLNESYDEEQARNLVERLKYTDVSTISYAVGIIGEWGSGKTSFLNTVRRNLKENKEITIDFNPWLALTERTVVQFFFKNLSDTVSEKISDELRGPLLEYADAISAIEGEDGILSRTLSLLKIRKDESPAALKAEISRILKIHRRTVYVFIDDLDRLNGEEIFEVLRLIRNTADFPHVVYIAAYDHQFKFRKYMI